MGLRVERLSLVDWRSFSEHTLSLAPGMTVLVGPNAVGKTNTIEALQLLTAGWSFRRPRPRDLVRTGQETARAEARLTGDGRVLDVACTVVEGRRSFVRNGKRVQAHELPGALMSVLFTPDDLLLVKGSASARRDEVDAFARQANGGYAKVLAAYLRAVEQRNRLLKEDYPDPGLLDAWDASVALGGATVLDARLRLFARLRDRMEEAYREMAGGEELRCSYVSTLGEDVTALTRDELVARFGTALAARRNEDLRRQQTTVGPHRDDLHFSIGGRDARTFASQGQQRSVALAWKIAEMAVAEEVVGDRPLLLLDDVMSELDGSRREALGTLVKRGTQVVVTTTNLGYFSEALLADATVINY